MYAFPCPPCPPQKPPPTPAEPAPPPAPPPPVELELPKAEQVKFYKWVLIEIQVQFHT